VGQRGADAAVRPLAFDAFSGLLPWELGTEHGAETLMLRPVDVVAAVAQRGWPPDAPDGWCSRCTTRRALERRHLGPGGRRRRRRAHRDV